MQLRYVYSELGQGLRRNLSMHIAVVLTLFVSLTLVGLGVVLNQQAARTADQWGSELQIAVFLCRERDDNPACTGEVTKPQKDAIQEVVEENPEVDSYDFESKAEAFDKVKELYDEDFEGVNAALKEEDLAESIWITLKDPDEFKGITSAVAGPRRGVEGPGPAQHRRPGPRLHRRHEVGRLPGGRVPGARRTAAGRATPSGWRRSRDARRSASCGWWAPPRSTSPCRSCSRRW